MVKWGLGLHEIHGGRDVQRGKQCLAMGIESERAGVRTDVEQVCCIASR